MSTNFDSLTLPELERKREALLRYAKEIEVIIKERKGEKSSIFSLSVTNNEKSNKITTSPKKDESPKKEKTKSKKKTVVKVKKKDTSKRKIKATVTDMKTTLTDNNVKFKGAIKRDEIEELIRQNNLVRVAEKISREKIEDK